MYKISVIIPIYNVEQYLAQCLDRVVNQTHQNLEIILINDGSTDSCPQICDDYAVKDSRIIVIHKQNGGLSDARNAGLKIATGDFISFIDSDDLVSIDFLEVLLKVLLDNNADIAECAFLNFEKPEEIEGHHENDARGVEVFNNDSIMKHLLTGPLSVVVWNKIYRKNAIDILFPVGRICEDVFFTYQVFGKANCVVRIPNALYFYRQRTGSIMGGDYSVKRLDALHAKEEMILFLQENFKDLGNIAIKSYCFLSMNHYVQLSLSPGVDRQKIYRGEIYQKVLHYSATLNKKEWNWKDKFWYKLFILSPNTYVKLFLWNQDRVRRKLEHSKINS